MIPLQSDFGHAAVSDGGYLHHAHTELVFSEGTCAFPSSCIAVACAVKQDTVGAGERALKGKRGRLALPLSARFEWRGQEIGQDHP